MSKKTIRRAIEHMKVLGIEFGSINLIDEGIWTRGVAFFGKDKLKSRVAFYDEMTDCLTVEV